MKILNSALLVARNKYFIATGCLLIWMIFFDPKDFSLILSRREKLKELQESEQALDKKIAETRKELKLLRTNAETIERYAREKYLMKKDNEDLFIVNEP